MLTLDKCVRPNQEEVAAKVIDGEAIIMNLNNGIYYSMDGVGGFIWEQIEKGLSVDAMVQAATRAYDVSAERARTDIERLLGELLEENVITLSDAPGPAGEHAEAPAERKPYSKPVLQTYRDMGDLLALDPPAPGLEDIPWKE